MKASIVSFAPPDAFFRPFVVFFDACLKLIDYSLPVSIVYEFMN
jgi:hypothetical protein